MTTNGNSMTNNNNNNIMSDEFSRLVQSGNAEANGSGEDTLPISAETRKNTTTVSVLTMSSSTSSSLKWMVLLVCVVGSMMIAVIVQSNSNNNNKITTTNTVVSSASSSLLNGGDPGDGSNFDPSHERVKPMTRKERKGPELRPCMFCHLNPLPPVLHEEASYTVPVLGGDGDDDGATAIVTPMTFTYNYELHDGQLLFTDPKTEIIPNLDFDYAVLAMKQVRNIHVDTGNDVSLDEVYLHHVTFPPIGMVGAEVLTQDSDYIPGYGYHVLVEEKPEININAHLLSNKNLQPIHGSIALAHKHCNECYYAPGKGSDCTPEVSGTFQCCGDSVSCTVGGENCACATTTNYAEHSITRYQLQVDMLISREVHKFKRTDTWTLAAPGCELNLLGEAVFEQYRPDNFCYNNTLDVFIGGSSLFHHIEEVPSDQAAINPYVKTSYSVLAPTSGLIVNVRNHLHTGGVNATLTINGKTICTTNTRYGTDPNPVTNIRNEQNHLVHIDSCNHMEWYRFEKGDVLKGESLYHGGRNDERFTPDSGAAGEHKNVMSYVTMVVIFDSEEGTYIDDPNRSSFNGFGDLVHAAGLDVKKLKEKLQQPDQFDDL